MHTLLLQSQSTTLSVAPMNSYEQVPSERLNYFTGLLILKKNPQHFYLLQDNIIGIFPGED